MIQSDDERRRILLELKQYQIPVPVALIAKWLHIAEPKIRLHLFHLQEDGLAEISEIQGTWCVRLSGRGRLRATLVNLKG